MQRWIQAELGSVDLGDARLEHRFLVVVQQCSLNPEGSFNAVCPTAADKKGAYRLTSNERVDPAAMREPHAQATWRRVGSYRRVLVLQDTTGMDFSSRRSTEGLGPLDTPYARGFLAHSGLAATPEGEPLGLVHQQVWVRDYEELGQSEQRRSRRYEDKESFKWQRTVEAVAERLPGHTECVVVGDRESDVYGLLAWPRPERIQLLVRSAQNRRLQQEAAGLHEGLQRQPVAGTVMVEVARARDRQPRRAVCEVRYGQFRLAPPRGADAGVPKVPVTVWAVSVTEQHPPSGEAPVHWILLATWPVGSFAEAVAVAQLYGRRWLVERYHFVLKSGCRIEEAQLRTQRRLERLLAIYCVVAWRLLATTYRARTDPCSSCEPLFTALEWQLLYAHEHRSAPPEADAEPPTIQQAVLWTAKLGGYWGRKADRPPGVKVIWRGLIRLQDIVLGYCLATPFHAQESCG